MLVCMAQTLNIIKGPCTYYANVQKKRLPSREGRFYDFYDRREMDLLHNHFEYILSGLNDIYSRCRSYRI